VAGYGLPVALKNKTTFARIVAGAHIYQKKAKSEKDGYIYSGANLSQFNAGAGTG